jgi:hypothetical protein
MLVAGSVPVRPCASDRDAGRLTCQLLTRPCARIAYSTYIHTRAPHTLIQRHTQTKGRNPCCGEFQLLFTQHQRDPNHGGLFASDLIGCVDRLLLS